jgi:zinc transport system permease protein
VRVVGLILVIALLTLPAATALQFIRSLGMVMLTTTILGIIFTGTGLVVAYNLDLPVGATIVLVAGSVYLLAAVISYRR